MRPLTINDSMRLYPYIRHTPEGYANFDREDYPLIKITFTGEKATDESFDDYLDGLYKNYENRDDIALIFDATKAGFPSIKYQSEQGQWMKKHDALIKEYCVGIAYVVPQKVLRNALRLIFKIYNNPVPFEVFETMEEGEQWVESLLVVDKMDA